MFKNCLEGRGEPQKSPPPHPHKTVRTEKPPPPPGKKSNKEEPTWGNVAIPPLWAPAGGGGE